jgi:hypothetical protein
LTATHHPPLELHSCSSLLAIELDLSKAPLPPLPLLLSREAAAEMARHIAEDLDAITDGIYHVGMVVPGALYDQTELLRPGFPLLKALEDIFFGTVRHGQFVPQLIALGTDESEFPIAAISPKRLPDSGPLLLLPVTFLGHEDDIAILSDALEDDLLQRGEVSAATQDCVSETFGIQALNMSYATVGDLCALLQVQMENGGFADLWALLAQALFRNSDTKQVVLENGNRFLLEGNRLYVPFYTFDSWAQFGPGRDRDASELAAGYGEWVLAHRQYTLTLQAYGLELRLLMGAPNLEQKDEQHALAAVQGAQPLEGDFLVEVVIPNRDDTPIQRLLVTHQVDRDVGAIADTVQGLDGDGRMLSLEHYYPLHLEGMDAIAEQLIQRSEKIGVERQVIRPEHLVYSATRRGLEAANE